MTRGGIDKRHTIILGQVSVRTPMTFKDILVHVDSTFLSRLRLRVGLKLARRCAGRVIGLHVIPDPVVPPYFKPGAVERIAAIYAEYAQEAAKDAATIFHDQVNGADVSTEWRIEHGDVAKLLAQHARFADLVILSQSEIDEAHLVPLFLLSKEVIMSSGTPILIVPGFSVLDDIGRRIVVAWDGSREAARAVRDSLSLLADADRVLLVAVDPQSQGHIDSGANAAEMAAHLARHGVRVDGQEILSGERSVAEALVSEVAHDRADLLVMGAYGHARIMEFVLGGTTHSLLAKATIPVFMSR